MSSTDHYAMPPWLYEPAPGTPAARLMEAAEAEVHDPPSADGLRAVAWAQDRIEEALR